MGVVLQRGYEDKRGLVSNNDESDESERRLESLGAMDFDWARKLLCACFGGVTVFVSLA